MARVNPPGFLRETDTRIIYTHDYAAMWISRHPKLFCSAMKIMVWSLVATLPLSTAQFSYFHGEIPILVDLQTFCWSHPQRSSEKSRPFHPFRSALKSLRPWRQRFWTFFYGGSPIAGWLILRHIKKKSWNGWFECLSTRILIITQTN